MRQIMMLAVMCSLPLTARAEGSVPVAVLPLMGKGKVAKTANRVLSKMDRVGGVEVLAGRALRKKLRKNPSSAAKKCAGDLPCLAELGRQAGVAHVIAATTATSGKATEIVFVLVAVASATAVHQEAIEITGAGMVEEQVLVALDALVKRVGQSSSTAAVAAGPETSTAETSTAETSTAETSTAETSTAEMSPAEMSPAETSPAETSTGETEPTTAGTEEIVAAPADGEDAGGAEVVPPPVDQPDSWFHPSWKSWAGVGGVAGGALMIGLGAHFGGVADELRDLNPRSTQLEVVQQEKDQNAAAVASTVLLSAGIATLAAGIGALAWDWLDGVPVITTGVVNGGAQAGVSWSW